MNVPLLHLMLGLSIDRKLQLGIIQKRYKFAESCAQTDDLLKENPWCNANRYEL